MLPELPDQVIDHELLLKALYCSILSDVYELDVHDSCPVTEHLRINILGEGGVVSTACCYPAFYSSCQIRHCPPHDLSHRQVGHVHDGLHGLDVLYDQAHPSAQVDQ